MYNKIYNIRKYALLVTAETTVKSISRTMGDESVILMLP